MPARAAKWSISAALALATPCICYYEGMVPNTYTDIVGIPSDCYGHTGHDVIPGAKYSPAQCLERLRGDEQREVDGVSACVIADLQPWEAAAIISMAHNVGVTGVCHSTMVRQLNAGAPPEQWCAQMLRWTHATRAGITIELPGLVKRRHTEYELCLGHTLPPEVIAAR